MDKRWLYRLWRHLPFRLQWAYLWCTSSHWLVGVLAVIADAEGRVLLLRHDYRREGQWALPGGQMQAPEGIEQCLARELAEETGLTIAVEALLAAHTAPTLPYLELIYRCRITGGQLTLGDEIAEARYFSLDELPADMFPDQVRVIRQALRAAPTP